MSSCLISWDCEMKSWCFLKSRLPARSVLLLRRGFHWTPAPPLSSDYISGITGVHSYTADSKVYYFLKWCIPFNKMLNYGCMICGILAIASAVYCVIALLNKDKTTIHQIYYIITPHLLKICIPFRASLNLGCIFYNIMRLECIRSAIRLRMKPLN